MPNSQNPSSPNFTPGVGRLVTDRFDFQAHVNGTNFRHNATMIDLSPDLTINGQFCTTVQQALQGLASALVTPVVQQATIGTAASNLGIITLGGDLAAASSTALTPIVGGLQGRPIATTPPVSGQVLGWNGSAWGPVASNAFSAAGDLAGTPTSQQVIGLTGNGSPLTVRISASTLQFISAAVPYITQTYVSAVNGVNTVLKAQGVSSGTGNGGNLVLAGGANSGSSLFGGVALSAAGDPAVDAGGQYVFQVVQPVVGQLVTAFFPPATGLTSTQMPTNSGNKVIYVGNVGAAPTTQSSTGVILWSASGKLNAMQSDGVSFTLQAEMGGDTTGNYPNPTVAKIQGTPVSNTAPTSGQTLTFNGSQWAPSNTNSLSKAYFGDGSDGTANFDGVHGVSGASGPSASQVYTLTRNIACTNINVSIGATIETDGYVIMCNGTLTLDGYIDNSGGAGGPGGTPTAAGIGAPWGWLGGGSNGGSGLFSSGAQTGINFATNIAVAGPPSFSQANVALGGIGGSSVNNAGTTNNPLAGITFSAHDLVLTDWLSSSRVLCSAPSTAYVGPALAIAYFGGGTGGGGGGSAGLGKNGGGGGGGGGIMVIAANTITGFGQITANGGVGANVTGSSNNNGGGGGGGGIVIIIYGTNTFTGLVQAVGGAGGTATGGAVGVAGNAGANGTIVLCPG